MRIIGLGPGLLVLCVVVLLTVEPIVLCEVAAADAGPVAGLPALPAGLACPILHLLACGVRLLILIVEPALRPHLLLIVAPALGAPGLLLLTAADDVDVGVGQVAVAVGAAVVLVVAEAGLVAAHLAGLEALLTHGLVAGTAQADGGLNVSHFSRRRWVALSSRLAHSWGGGGWVLSTFSRGGPSPWSVKLGSLSLQPVKLRIGSHPLREKLTPPRPKVDRGVPAIRRLTTTTKMTDTTETTTAGSIDWENYRGSNLARFNSHVKQYFKRDPSSKPRKERLHDAVSGSNDSLVAMAVHAADRIMDLAAGTDHLKKSNKEKTPQEIADEHFVFATELYKTAAALAERMDAEYWKRHNASCAAWDKRWAAQKKED